MDGLERRDEFMKLRSLAGRLETLAKEIHGVDLGSSLINDDGIKAIKKKVKETLEREIAQL